MAKRRRNGFDLAAGLGLASLHTGITLFYRLPMLAASFSASGKERHARELNRMVGEKTSAMFDGILDANKEFLRLAAERATVKPRHCQKTGLVSTYLARRLMSALGH